VVAYTCKDSGTTNYTYDNNGSQLTTTIGASTTTNTYDLFGQLKSYTGMDSVVTNYTYGPDGLRTCKASGNTSTAYVWDGGNIKNEFVSVTVNGNTTTTQNRYVYGIGKIKAYFGTTEVYYLYNAHGDVTGLTNVSCDLTKSYVYDAFGIEVNPDPVDANPFRYCGEYFDKETETYYLRARYYKSSTGRFTQQDPIGDGLNWYVYCNNNPVSFIDPSGLAYIVGDTDDFVIGDNDDFRKFQEKTGGTFDDYMNLAPSSWSSCDYINFGELILAVPKASGRVSATPTVVDGNGFHNPTVIYPNVSGPFGEYHAEFGGYHLGVDIGNGGETEPGKYANSSIYAIYDGELMYSNYRSKNGNIIVLRHKLPNGVIFYSSYSHLASFNVPMVDKQDENPENDIYFEMKIDGGTLIGKMGDTGGDGMHICI